MLNPTIAPPRTNYCGMTNIILGMEVPKSPVTNNSRDKKLHKPRLHAAFKPDWNPD